MSELHTFIFEGLPVRGAIVRLTSDWQELLKRREQHGSADTEAEIGSGKYHELVRNLLGEMTAAAVLMHSNIKFNGSLVLQVMGGERKDTSPVKLLVAEVRSDFAFRATAKIVQAIKGSESMSQLINAGNQARCAITLDPQVKFQGQQAYQGIVPLYDDHGVPLESIAHVVEHDIRQSEQLDNNLGLGANGDMAVGILIQRMPIKGENNLAGALTKFELSSTENEDAIGKNEDFNRIATLTASIKQEELLTLSIDDILHRLFWNEPIARYAPTQPSPRFACTCSRERVASTIRSLGQSEAEKMIEDKNGIHVDCDFCGQHYSFDVIDAAMLFMPDRSAAVVAPPRALQ